MDRNIEVNWTGAYPALCSGEWEFKIDGVVLKDKSCIDEDGYYEWESWITKPLNTAKTYQEWHFEENYEAVFEDYEMGLDYFDWIESKEGRSVLYLLNQNGITLTDEEREDLYNKIVESDWQSNSCGGCI